MKPPVFRHIGKQVVLYRKSGQFKLSIPFPFIELQMMHFNQRCYAGADTQNSLACRRIHEVAPSELALLKIQNLKLVLVGPK
ncbi:MAG: hypothetical protein KME45_05775 [Stenomitos rutilans HA7619-LM2]|jgi:hypothetical protein|nr:hypothetical protein [Stenomitos rutilans HA7619-LM2]